MNQDEFNSAETESKLRMELIHESIKKPKREWVGLTDEEVDYLVETEDWYNDPSEFAKIIQNKLKVLNT